MASVKADASLATWVAQSQIKLVEKKKNYYTTQHFTMKKKVNICGGGFKLKKSLNWNWTGRNVHVLILENMFNHLDLPLSVCIYSVCHLILKKPHDFPNSARLHRFSLTVITFMKGSGGSINKSASLKYKPTKKGYQDILRTFGET